MMKYHRAKQECKILKGKLREELYSSYDPFLHIPCKMMDKIISVYIKGLEELSTNRYIGWVNHTFDVVIRTPEEQKVRDILKSILCVAFVRVTSLMSSKKGTRGRKYKFEIRLCVHREGETI